MPEQSITPRQLSDRYVDELVALDPLVATSLGLPDGADRFGDLSPAGSQQRSALRRRTLSDLDALESVEVGQGPAPQRGSLLTAGGRQVAEPVGPVRQAK